MTGTGVMAAFVAAQAELTNPIKDKTANIKQGFSYSYADLAAILDHVRPVLAKHSLAITQDVGVTDNGRLAVTTMILHADGSTLRFGPLVGDAGRDWQSHGGAITYARRYALTAALGIAADDDDDAGTVTAQQRQQAKQEQQPKSDLSATQQAALIAAMAEAESIDRLDEIGQRAATFAMSDEQRERLRNLYLERKSALEAAS